MFSAVRRYRRPAFEKVTGKVQVMKITSIYAAMLTFMGTAAMAQVRPMAPSVPEIDALSGFAAVAVVGAAVALIRERNKR